MERWKIFRGVDDYVIVRARTFSEALAKARMRDPEYNSGYTCWTMTKIEPKRPAGCLSGDDLPALMMVGQKFFIPLAP